MIYQYCFPALSNMQSFPPVQRLFVLSCLMVELNRMVISDDGYVSHIHELAMSFVLKA